MTDVATATTATDDAQALRDRLEAERRAVCEELRHYPPQVAGCDLHYKDLAERRAALSAALARLDADGNNTDDPAAGRPTR